MEWHQGTDQWDGGSYGSDAISTLFRVRDTYIAFARSYEKSGRYKTTTRWIQVHPSQWMRQDFAAQKPTIRDITKTEISESIYRASILKG